MSTGEQRRKKAGGVTQEDVGRLAGVSGKTVSRVLAKDPHVSAATRERVEAIIEQTGFRPNFAARSLAAAKSHLIAIFVPDRPSLYHADLFRGAASACASLGYHLLLEQYEETGEASYSLRRYETSLRRAGCDGVILPPPLSNDDDLIARLQEDGIQHVRIAPGCAVGDSPAVIADETAGVAALVEHLWSLGHRRFGLFSPPLGRPYLNGRNQSFVEEVTARGAQATDLKTAEFHWEGSGILSGRRGAKALLESPDRPDAIFAFNDEFAHGAMICAQEMALPVPDRLSVAGFDDGAAAQFAWPPLTTVRQPLEHMAEKAVELLVRGGGNYHCQVELIVRHSTGRKATDECP